MTNEIKKKEELIKENAVLAQNNKDLGEQAEKLKADMCRVLGFSYFENDYGSRKEKLFVKTWAEIFAEIGKLKANKDFRDMEQDVSVQRSRLENLEEKIIKEIHPNL